MCLQIFLAAGDLRDKEAAKEDIRCALYEMPREVYAAWINTYQPPVTPANRTILDTHLAALQANCTEVRKCRVGHARTKPP